MKLPASFSKFSRVEMAALVAFVLYIVLPINTPSALIPLIDSPIGYIAVIVGGIAIFTYSNPILGVLFIFVAYEIIRRSSKQAVPRDSDNRVVIQHMPSHIPITEVSSEMEKNMNLQQMAFPVTTSLEEEMVAIRAPIGQGSPMDMAPPSFQPVSNKLNGASLI